jgi:hypothetical protein
MLLLHGNCGDDLGARPVGMTRPKIGSSLLIPLPTAEGTRGAYNESNVHRRGETWTQRTKPPTWHAKCRSLTTLPLASLPEQPIVVRCSRD